MEVCGVDPGLGTSGYAILTVADGPPTVREAGVCRTDANADLAERLAQIEHDFTNILDQWRPDVMGVEELYAHYKHPRTAILMGHARGVLLAVAARFDVAVRSYSATHVKRFLTGNGRASKSQIQRVIQTTLQLTEVPEPNDVADALAIGLCCVQHIRDERMELSPA